MMTLEQLGYLDKILMYIPDEDEFRISDLLQNFLEGSPDIILPDINSEVQAASIEITDFLLQKEFATNDVPPNFVEDLQQYNSLLLELTDTGKELKRAGSFRNYAKDWLQEQDQLIRLDWMLNFLSIHAIQGIGIENAWIRVKEIHPTMHVEYLESYRQQMLSKLKEDGFIELFDSTCRVTLEGILFSRTGYKKQEIKKISDVESEKRKENLLIWGTWLAGIGGILLFLIELAKRFHMSYLSYVFAVQMWVFALVFFFGAISALITILLVKEILNRRKG
ncbi:MAG: hypothetical protein JNL72_13875 [Flavipsychrobacter sp.]|nr:hypothetical protein [Flavipsychrobacter sp.]